MKKPVPELKTNEIFHQIQPSIVSGELLLAETKLYALLREARDIPDAGESLSVQGLIYIIWGKIEQGSSLCESALVESPYSPATWANYALAVGRRFRFRQQTEILLRGMDYESPIIIRLALDQALFWSDYPMAIEASKKLDKLDLENPDKEAVSKMLSLVQDFPEDGIDLTNLATCVMDIAEIEKIPALSTVIETDVEGTHCFCFRVENISNAKLYELNDKLANLIVERGLSGVDSVAMFDRRLKHVN